MRLLYGHDKIIAAWVNGRIPYLKDIEFGPCIGIGVVNGAGNPIAGVVYHDYQPQYGTMQASVASITPRWCTHRILKELLSYPFLQAGVQKLWVAIAHPNQRAIRFVKGIGFTQEAVLASHFGDHHCVMLRMFKKDYKKRYLDGKEIKS